MELDSSERVYDVRRECALRPDDDGSQWVALATHPHKERTAIENLERQGFSAYCPMMRKVVRHARKSQEVLRPFFPGYVFAGFGSATSRWRSMASTIGVRRVIAVGEKPCLLSEDFISSLRARELEGAITKPVSPYSLGQKVSLTGEPLKAWLRPSSRWMRSSGSLCFLTCLARAFAYAPNSKA